MTGGIQPLVVAGGGSRRFGENKALALLAGRTFIDHVLDALALVPGGTPWIGVRSAGSDPQFTAHLLARGDVTFVEDHPGLAGPLASVASALTQAARDEVDWVLAVACDTPAIRPQLLDALCERARCADAEVSAVVPRTRTEDGLKFQALHALYRPGTVSIAVRANSLQDFIRQLPSVDVLDEPELAALDPHFATSLFNVNTPADRDTLTDLFFSLG
jgi:molybdopterin-guanine dinucleotide biosynthesis protein A